MAGHCSVTSPGAETVGGVLSLTVTLFVDAAEQPLLEVLLRVKVKLVEQAVPAVWQAAST